MEVQAFATGILSAFGHSPKVAAKNFEGDASFTLSGSKLEDAKVEVRIYADSMTVIDNLTDRDRQEIERTMHNDVLETSRFSEIVYEWAGTLESGNGERFWATIEGALRLRGVTHKLPVSARVAINEESLRASGEFTLRQSDYEIAIVTAAAGAIKLKDEVRGRFDILARKQA